MPDNEKPSTESAGEKKPSPREAGSPGDYIDRDPVFHYSREHRLSKASQAVQDLNAGKNRQLPLVQRLFGHRNNIIILVSLVFIIGAYSLVSRFSGGTEGSINLGGNTLAVEMIKEGEIPILGIVKKTPKKGEAYTGAVDIAVSPVMQKSKDTDAKELPPVFTHRIFFTGEDSEEYSISVPFGGTDFYILFRTYDEQKSLKIRAVEEKLTK